MATTSKDGSRRETCPIYEEAVMGRELVVRCRETDLYWRARRVPAAAVIPAPRVSMVNAAVKRSVVLYVLFAGVCSL